MDPFRSVFNRPHREGQPFILIAFALAVLFFFVWQPLGWIFVILTLYVIYFFRDPARVTPQLDGVVISAADGIVAKVDEAVPPQELEMGDEPRARISVFLSVFNVHVNRNPASGRVTKLVYVPGKFVNAALDKASEDNERQLIRLESEAGDLACVQIAGLIARRIVCGLKEGQEVRMGERFGMIRFGSRVDVYAPKGWQATVAEGQTAVAGETVIAAAKPYADVLTGRRT